MCAFFQHFTFTYKTQLRLIVPCPSAPPGSHNTESDMLVLQYVYYRSRQSSFTLFQSQSWGVVRNSQINMKLAKTQNISSKQKQHVPGAGLKPPLMVRCSFLLHSRSLWASRPFSSMLRPPIDGADPSTSAHHRSVNVVPVFICAFHSSRNLVNFSPGTCGPRNPVSHFLFSCSTN